MDCKVRIAWCRQTSLLLHCFSISKASLAASVIFVCERLHVITMPHPFVYLGVVSFFVYFKLSSLLLGIADPFVPLENLFCAIFMGGMRDALCRAVSSSPSKQADRDSALRADVAKSKEEKSDWAINWWWCFDVWRTWRVFPEKATQVLCALEGRCVEACSWDTLWWHIICAVLSH